ncbi:hypothetical protein LC082_10375 [Microbacterium esteraromaticum]|uniref:hypothetical protein n=1 Tax=Microbacterium esteraromaticum TaxID=57043 RepID=UPI001CD5CC83|nr:hypothetical protein [Microbacterium esteraromaticum]MCA1307304.1 hypothetical protein [Microbacterium esteraromaticum]
MILVPMLLLAVVSFRVKAWVHDDTLTIRSYWRTRRYLLQDLDPVTTEPYTGWWAGQVGFPGLDVLVLSARGSWELEVRQETICLTRTANRLAEELSALVEEAAGPPVGWDTPQP